MKKLLTALFILSSIYSYALADNLTEKHLQELKGIKVDNISEDILKAAQEAYREHLNIALPKADKYISSFDITDNNLTYSASDNKSRYIFNRELAATERIYVFMSSSVPLVVWKNYSQSIKGIKNAVFVLRGCVGGCTPEGFRKTTWFLRSIDNDSTRAIIDPMLFRLYDITEVPTIVYAVNIPNLDIGSEGNTALLPNRQIPSHRKSIGDWSLDYHLEQLGLKP